MVNHPAEDFTLKEARHTLAFWVFALTLSLQALFSTAFTFHIASIFSEANLDKSMAIGFFFPCAVIAVFVNLVGSWATNYTKMEHILKVQLLSMGVTAFALITISEGTSYYLFILGGGVMGGLYSVVTSLLWPRYYGLAHLGAISGLAMSFMVAGSALGPYLFSLFLDTTGHYNGAIYLVGILLVALFIASFFTHRPSSRPDVSKEELSKY